MTMAPVAVTAACVGCGACLPTCPERAFLPRIPGPGRAPLGVRADRCTGCLECIEVCPVDAIITTTDVRTEASASPHTVIGTRAALASAQVV